MQLSLRMKNKEVSIFIIEDNKLFSHALKEDIEIVFGNRQVKVQSFETGELCMSEFRLQPSNIVILDYHLNSKYPLAIDGIKVLDWIKKTNFSTHVIMLTASDDIDTALKSFKHGASDYIVKSENKFKKINNAIFNFFSILDAKRDARRYRILGIGLIVTLSLLIGSLLSIFIFAPAVFK